MMAHFLSRTKSTQQTSRDYILEYAASLMNKTLSENLLVTLE
jgi:hypothetical protein